MLGPHRGRVLPPPPGLMYVEPSWISLGISEAEAPHRPPHHITRKLQHFLSLLQLLAPLWWVKRWECRSVTLWEKRGIQNRGPSHPLRAASLSFCFPVLSSHPQTSLVSSWTLGCHTCPFSQSQAPTSLCSGHLVLSPPIFQKHLLHTCDHQPHVCPPGLTFCYWLLRS